MSERFQGWRNKFTWLCELHLENDEYIYNDIRCYVRDLKTLSKDKADTIYCLKDYIYNYVKENLLSNENFSIFETDLIEYAIAEIDFWEIAENWLDM